MVDVVTRLRNPPFGTETSERLLMVAAADEIDDLRAFVREFAWTVATTAMPETAITRLAPYCDKARAILAPSERGSTHE